MGLIASASAVYLPIRLFSSHSTSTVRLLPNSQRTYCRSCTTKAVSGNLRFQSSPYFLAFRQINKAAALSAMMTDRNIILIDEHHDDAKEVDMDSLDSEQLKEYREELEALGSFPVCSSTNCSRSF